MNGKVCVVTGATSGIGKAAATALARMGAQIVLVGRDQGRTEATAAEIGANAAVPPKAEIADLASMEQVRALAGRLGSLERSGVNRRPPPVTMRPRGGCGTSARS